MAGRGPAPKVDKVTRVVPTRGDVRQAEAACWVGDVPEPPEGLMSASSDAWAVWFGSWFAAFWTSSDVPGIRQMIRLYDQVERGEFGRAGELRLQMDTYGVTPKGQQDRRWKPPAAPAAPVTGIDGGGRRYDKLRAV